MGIIQHRRDERFRDAIDGRTVQLFIVWFFICIALTVGGVMAVGNIAHGAGAVLGILTGFAITLPERRATIGAGIGVILAFGFWASTVGRPKMNLSQYGAYDECKAGDEAMRAEHYEEALKWLQIAAAYKSNPAGCLTDLGYTYQNMGQLDQAVAQYRKAADRGDADGQFYLATMYEKGTGLPKDAKQAVSWYRKAADQSSGEKANADVLNNVAWALATSSEPEVRSPAAALEYAQRAVAAEKGQPRAHILDTMAESYYVNGRYDEAVKTEQRALQLAQPSDKANYLKQLEKFQQALSGNKQTANAE